MILRVNLILNSYQEDSQISCGALIRTKVLLACAYWDGGTLCTVLWTVSGDEFYRINSRTTNSLVIPGRTIPCIACSVKRRSASCKAQTVHKRFRECNLMVIITVWLVRCWMFYERAPGLSILRPMIEYCSATNFRVLFCHLESDA